MLNESVYFVHILRKNLFAFFVFSVLSFQIFAQSENQKNKLFLYNISLGAVIGGVGAFINPPQNEHRTISFLKGTLKGSLGGLGIYSSKRLAHKIVTERSLWYSWPTRLSHSISTSIIHNAASGNSIWHQLSYDAYFFRFSYFPGKNSFSTRLLPINTINFFYALSKNSLDIGKSLQLGVPLFSTEGLVEGESFGKAFVQNIVISDRYKARYGDSYSLISHELLHVLQYQEYTTLNALFNPVIKWANKSANISTVFKYVYFDPPYFPLALETQSDSSPLCPYKNFFEFEAEYFSILRHVPRCR